MNPLVRQLIAEQETETKGERTYKISGRNDHLDELEKFFRWMNGTASGHSGAVQIAIDGDGAARMHVERVDSKDELHPRDEDVNGSGRVEMKISLE